MEALRFVVVRLFLRAYVYTCVRQACHRLLVSCYFHSVMLLLLLLWLRANLA